MSDPSRKIPWEAVGGLALAAVAAFAFFRTSGDGNNAVGTQVAHDKAVHEKAVLDKAVLEATATTVGVNLGAESGAVGGPTAGDGSSVDEVVDELKVAGDRRGAIKPDDVAVFMRAKLDHSQHVIEGLALEDYQAIYRAAHDLALASQASAWEVLLTEEYSRQSADFRRSCEALRKAARDENLDAAALAWMEVTMKCVQCHKYVRQADVEAR